MESKNPGAFPFPLTIATQESRYLTWVRNHSNYMAERGFLDYMRIVAILVRGVLVNFLTLLPLLILTALLIGVLYNPMLDSWQPPEEAKPPAAASSLLESAVAAEVVEVEKPDLIFPTRPLGNRPALEADGNAGDRVWHWIGGWPWKIPRNAAPYLLTPFVALAALAYFLLFPVVIRIFNVISHRKSLESGSGSSVKLRDKYERSFGGALIVVGCFLLLETLPLLLHNFHEAKNFGWRGTFSSVAGLSSVIALSSASPVIKLLRGRLQTVAMAVIGILGMALPLLVVLYIGEFLVYSGGDFETDFAKLAIIPVLLIASILGALVLGLKKGGFDHIGWLLRLVLYVALALLGIYLLDRFGWMGGGWFFVFAIAVEVWLFCFLAVDVNLTSVHGLYRDRLASAYLVGQDTTGDVDIEEDIDLHSISLYETYSTAPYHLINVAHNLQSSKDMTVRERNSDFFVFSKRFTGGDRTGYCRSEHMERVFPQMDLATAMAISAAAAAPNMGANTSRAMVAFLTLLNVRLGYWVPNPKHLNSAFGDEAKSGEEPAGIEFKQVFKGELSDLRTRWKNLPSGASVRDQPEMDGPSPEHGLIGVGFSGGGIRSATINMGIAQALHRSGVFDQIDYMSTVSGGGYLGSSLSTLMRKGARVFSEVDGKTAVKESGDDQVITVAPNNGGEAKVYRFRKEAELSDEVKSGAIGEGQRLIRDQVKRGQLGERFTWRVRPRAFIREMFSRLDETHKWVNLSDGGHLENLATIELLRRRCRFILMGDGEADPKLHFGSLATLIRFARLDLGITIQIDPGEIRLEDGRSRHHFAVGRILYPKFEGGGHEAVEGRLLYLKSSFTGDEEEVVQQYRASHPAFPHESTADQFFDEGQFEAYRSLGQHIGEQALAYAPGGSHSGDLMKRWLSSEGETQPKVTGFFDGWFRNLEGALPTPWTDSSS
jgi:hypothetical protein